MGMGVSFQYPMGMGTDMGVIFENGSGCGYSSTRPQPAPLPFLSITTSKDRNLVAGGVISYGSIQNIMEVDFWPNLGLCYLAVIGFTQILIILG